MLAFTPEYRAVISLHIAIFIAHCDGFNLLSLIRRYFQLSLNLLIVQCAARCLGLQLSNRVSKPLDQCLSFHFFNVLPTIPAITSAIVR